MKRNAADRFDSLLGLLDKRFGRSYRVHEQSDYARAKTSYESQFEVFIPRDYECFLKHCNGISFGTLAIYGLADNSPEFDGATVHEVFPNWRCLGWVPVASNGCGSYWVIATNHRFGSPVLFIDCTSNADQPAYVVASGFWPFAEGLIRQESAVSQSEEEWPFDEDEVLRWDPAISDFSPPYRLPWDTLDD